MKAWDNAKRPKLCKLQLNRRLCAVVGEKLLLKWAPEQISGWLKQKYSSDPSMNISHEAIYRTLLVPSRACLEKSLIRNLRTKRKMRQPRQFNTKGVPRGQSFEHLSIHDRPPEVENRSTFGHWEGDLTCGSKNSHIATLGERKSTFTLLLRLKGKEATSVTTALVARLSELPDTFKQSITWDRGPELASHHEITQFTNIAVYFCDPQSPWQRGTNENTNGLLRQYFPKKTNLSCYTQKYLDEVAKELNQRPRKVLGYNSPEEVS